MQSLSLTIYIDAVLFYLYMKFEQCWLTGFREKKLKSWFVNLAEVTLLRSVIWIARLLFYLLMEYEPDWSSGFDVGIFQRLCRLSNMAANSFDHHELCNLTTQSTTLYPYEIWARSVHWFLRRRFSKILIKIQHGTKYFDMTKWHKWFHSALYIR